MSKQQLFNWLNAKVFKPRPKIIFYGSYSETPNYYIESTFDKFVVEGQLTKLKITEDTSGRNWITISDNFGFEGYGV